MIFIPCRNNKGVPFEDAVATVRAAREEISINDGFMEQVTYKILHIIGLSYLELAFFDF